MSSEGPNAPIRPGAVRFRSVTKAYDRHADHGRWRLAVPLIEPSLREPILALDDVDLTIEPGESVGLIGPNGSGKSTALKLLAGVVAHSRGEVHIGGRIGSMIELGLGFHPDLTGWENLTASAAMMEVTGRELAAVSDDIVAFAGLEHAMDEPLREYSTGMEARLGFALATHVPADVLLVDEVLAVGDPEFQMRCLDKIHQMHKKGTTLIYVSHEMWAVDIVCERTVRLDRGRIIDDGPTRDVIREYLMPRATASAVDTDARTIATVDALTAEPSTLAPLEPTSLRADVTVVEPIDDLRIETDLAWATIAPDQPIARHQAPVPKALTEPGRYTLVGRSDPVPTDSGHVAATVRLLDARERLTLSEATAEFVIENDEAGRRPQLAVEMTCNIEPAEPPDQDAPPPTTWESRGPVVASLEGVTKRFKSGLRRTIAHMAIPGPVGERHKETMTAVDDIDLSIPGGYATGLIGPNGAGKTTILRLLAGTMAATSGRVWVAGRVVSMLDLGLGFHGDLTGMENIHAAGALLGLSKGELRRQLPDILDFAGIGDAVHAPVRQYSTGMQARLGLSVALHSDPDLLLIDEVLAVGDEDFRTRAVDATNARRDAGAAVVFVSHDLRLVEEVCDRVVRIEHGRVVDDGPAADVVDRSGGPGWSGGTTQATSAVHLHEIRVHRRRVSTGANVELGGWVEVTDASPTVRLELGYRAHLDPETTTLSSEDVAAHTMVNRIIEPPGGRLAEPGWYRYEATLKGNAIMGEVDVVLAAVDSDDGTTVAESWQGVTFGHPGPVEADELTPVTTPVALKWSVEEQPTPAEAPSVAEAPS